MLTRVHLVSVPSVMNWLHSGDAYVLFGAIKINRGDHFVTISKG